jgi:hypothetical protein
LSAPGIPDALGTVGAKYLPTIKDLKATQRFQKTEPDAQVQKVERGQSRKKR